MFTENCKTLKQSLKLVEAMLELRPEVILLRFVNAGIKLHLNDDHRHDCTTWSSPSLLL